MQPLTYQGRRRPCKPPKRPIHVSYGSPWLRQKTHPRIVTVHLCLCEDRAWYFAQATAVPMMKETTETVVVPATVFATAIQTEENQHSTAEAPQVARRDPAVRPKTPLTAPQTVHPRDCPLGPLWCRESPPPGVRTGPALHHLQLTPSPTLVEQVCRKGLLQDWPPETGSHRFPVSQS